MLAYSAANMVRGSRFSSKVPVTIQQDEQAPPCESFDSLDRWVQEFMTAHSIGAGCLAIAQHGQVVYDRGFGHQDLDQIQPVSPDLMGRLASVSKPFTAAVIRELERLGKLNLDQPVFELNGNGGLLQYSPLRKPDPRLGRITSRMLLVHQTGWGRDYVSD